MDNIKKIGVVKWAGSDGIAAALGPELVDLGYEVQYFLFDEPIPPYLDLILTFAPYNDLYPLHSRIAQIPHDERPFYVHWNFESLPSPLIPWPMLKSLAQIRTWVNRKNYSSNDLVKIIFSISPIKFFDGRMNKFRYLGENHHALINGWMNLLADISDVQANIYKKHGVDAVYIPWGTSKTWHKELNLKRDIDLLWMGKRRTRRRSKLLDKICAELGEAGINCFIADGLENPFVYDQERIEILNRSKITLNLLPTWYDPAFIFRFHMAAGNRSLVISEPILQHNEKYAAGENYVSAPIEQLCDVILYYLNHEGERQEIIDNAYVLVTTEMTLTSSVKQLLNAVIRHRDIADP